MAGLLAGASIAAAAFPSQAELPPAAQAPFDKAMVAARQQAWDIAIQNLREARQAAPNAPELLYNLGLAESKLPGRELRAIAWFGAYLAAEPKAENAQAVRDFIANLQVKNETDTQRLARTVQAAAEQIPYESGGASTTRRDQALVEVAGLWAWVGNTEAAVAAAALISPGDVGETASARSAIVDGEIARIRRTAGGGDFLAAQRAAAAISGQDEADRARDAIASARMDNVEAQIKAGDISGALRSANLIDRVSYKCSAEVDLAVAQANAGDIAAAQASLAAAAQDAERVSPSDQSLARDNLTRARVAIADNQLATGDIAGAQRTAEALTDSHGGDDKSRTEDQILHAQLNRGEIDAGLKTVELIAEPRSRVYALVDIAKAQAGAADVTGANATLLTVRRAIELPENASLKTVVEGPIDVAETAVAEAQLKAGDGHGARQTVMLVIKAAETMPPGWWRNLVQLSVARVQAESADLAGAQKTAEGLVDPYDRRSAYVAIAEARAKAGDLAGARASLVLAEAAAELVSQAPYKVAGEVDIAGEQVKIGDPDSARATILMAEQAAQSIADPSGRARAELGIARARAKTGDLAGARSAIVAAQDFAEEVTDAQEQVPLETFIAETEAEIGDPVGARASILIARRAAGPTPHAFLEQDIADAQIKAGDLPGASQTADLIFDLNVWRAVIDDIARAQGGGAAPTAAAKVAASLPRYPPRQPLVTVAAWTAELTALDKPLFLDPAAYLQTLPSDTPQKGFDALMQATRTVVEAEGEVEVMLARQGA